MSAEQEEIQAYRALLERLRVNAHSDHAEKRIPGTDTFERVNIETCQKWACFHIGVYLRHFASERV